MENIANWVELSSDTHDIVGHLFAAFTDLGEVAAAVSEVVKLFA